MALPFKHLPVDYQAEAKSEAAMAQYMMDAKKWFEKSGLADERVFNRLSEDQTQAFIEKARRDARRLAEQRLVEWLNEALLPHYFKFTELRNPIRNHRNAA